MILPRYQIPRPELKRPPLRTPQALPETARVHADTAHAIDLFAGAVRRSPAAHSRHLEPGTDIGRLDGHEAKPNRVARRCRMPLRFSAYHNGYFGLPYPLPKLDLIAVPNEYAAGAMEELGRHYLHRLCAPHERVFIGVNAAARFSPLSRAYRDKHTCGQVTSRDDGVVGRSVAQRGKASPRGWSTKATDHFNPEWLKCG